MSHDGEEFDLLSCRITAALQVYPRASWSRIATVLGEAERTVTRRGKELLESGDVRVVGVIGASGVAILRARCLLGMTRSVAAGLARRDDTVFVYATSGEEDCVAELQVDDAHLADLVLDDLPSVAGIRELRIDPITRLYRSVREWRPGILTPAQVGALARSRQDVYQPDGSGGSEIPDVHRAILRILAHDARTPTSEIGRMVGISENTVRRHLESLEANHQSRLRVVVEPSLLGFKAEAMVWVNVPPARHDALVEALLKHSEVRYAAALAGTNSVLVNLACTDRLALHQMVTRSEWSALAESVSVTPILKATKRSGSRLGAAASASYLY